MEAAKMEAHAAAMKATNGATHLSLAKMTQESKILMADMAKMDPLARAWHEMHRERIGQEVLAARGASASMIAEVLAARGASASMIASAPSTFMPPSAPSTFMPPSAPVEPVPTMEVPPVLADDEDVVEA
jgi:hypothetical protein